MLYLIYEEINGVLAEDLGSEHINGLVKTEDEAKRYCERENTLIALDTERNEDHFSYKEVDDSYTEYCNFIDTSILDCDFFNASVLLGTNVCSIGIFDNGIYRKKEIIQNDDGLSLTVISSFPIGITKEELLNKAKSLVIGGKFN